MDHSKPTLDWSLDWSTFDRQRTRKDTGEIGYICVSDHSVTVHKGSPGSVQYADYIDEVNSHPDSHLDWLGGWLISSPLGVGSSDPLGSDGDDLNGQLEMLPTNEEMLEVASALGRDDLIEFLTAIMDIAVNSAHLRMLDLDTIRVINGWFASMEATVAAGDHLDDILARRRRPQDNL